MFQEEKKRRQQTELCVSYSKTRREMLSIRNDMRNREDERDQKLK